MDDFVNAMKDVASNERSNVSHDHTYKYLFKDLIVLVGNAVLILSVSAGRKYFDCAGGVILASGDGKIVFENTIDSTLELFSIRVSRVQEMSICGLDMKFKDYNAALNECVKHKSLTGGQRVHTRMIEIHYLPPLFLRTRLIVLYSECRDDALMVFGEMPVKNVMHDSSEECLKVFFLVSRFS